MFIFDFNTSRSFWISAAKIFQSLEKSLPVELWYFSAINCVPLYNVIIQLLRSGTLLVLPDRAGCGLNCLRVNDLTTNRRVGIKGHGDPPSVSQWHRAKSYLVVVRCTKIVCVCSKIVTVSLYKYLCDSFVLLSRN